VTTTQTAVKNCKLPDEILAWWNIVETFGRLGVGWVSTEGWVKADMLVA